MSMAPLSDYLQKRFMQVSSEYLLPDLYHGDTETSHPYVRGTLEAEQIVVPAVKVVERSATPAAMPPLSWHGQYCLQKFGKTTPGQAPR